MDIYQEKWLLHKFILQLSLPVVVFDFIIQVLPFIMPYQEIPNAFYLWAFPVFLLLYLTIAVPYFLIQLLRINEDAILHAKNLLYVLSVTAILMFFGAMSVYSLFTGVILPIFFSPIIFGSLMNTGLIIMLILITITLTKFFFVRSQREAHRTAQI